MDYPLARLDGILLMVATLTKSGAICPECGHGTLKTSARWAACKRCGRRRIPTMSVEAAAEALKEGK